MSEVTLETPLVKVLGTSAKKLAKARNLETVGDLLHYFPRRYIDAHAGSSFSEFELGEHVVLTAEVAEMTQRRMKNRRGSMANAVIVDEPARGGLWPQAAPLPARGIGSARPPGQKPCRLRGRLLLGAKAV